MNKKTKIIASIAVVGTVAAFVAFAGMDGTSQAIHNRRMLQAGVSEEDAVAFQGFVAEHNRNFLTREEYTARQAIFASNMAIIRGQDAAVAGYELGITEFIDLSDEEFEKRLGLKPLPEGQDGFLQPAEEEKEEEKDGDRHLQSYPASLDWRQSGVLNPIRNQGGCGGCYSFSALASLEALIKIKKGVLPQLSEQQIIDCSGSYGNAGCGGGLMSNSFNYLKAYNSNNRAAYPYTAVKSTCKYNAANGSYKVSGYKNIAANDPNAHMAALQTAPVSVAVAASSSVFRLYKSGIITSTGCGTSINHAVNMVGYGTENGTPYWIVRNSWGTSWGEAGYFRILRNTVSGAGICGLLKLSSQPTIA